jgi:preprotein translocase subunit Sec63
MAAVKDLAVGWLSDAESAIKRGSLEYAADKLKMLSSERARLTEKQRIKLCNLYIALTRKKRGAN